MAKRHIPLILFAAGLTTCLALDLTGGLDPYVAQIVIYIGINIILTVSLNLVNGYMGEFSVGHAGFMAVGAYAAAYASVNLLPHSAWFFPLALATGGICAGLLGLLVAIPAFRARDDYLAIITLALLMIVKSAFDNLPWFGGPQGFYGIEKYTNLSWVFVWTVLSVAAIRNIVYSRFGRAIIAIRDDEIAATLVSVDTRHTKILAFVTSSFFAGIAGGLFAHVIQFINPRTFSLVKSTDILLMLYLGGGGSLAGSIVGATIWTLAIEFLRFLGIWRFVVAPVALIVLMIYRPRGIMGGRELPWLVPRDYRKE
jgi:branched-chain amino acid transport system permease protein